MNPYMKDFGKKSMPRVGASITIGESFLVELLQYTKERHPEFSIFSEIHNTTELESMKMPVHILFAVHTNLTIFPRF